MPALKQCSAVLLQAPPLPVAGGPAPPPAVHARLPCPLGSAPVSPALWRHAAHAVPAVHAAPAAQAAPEGARPAEAFVVCQGFQAPPGFRPELLHDLLSQSAAQHSAARPATLAERQLVPFLACGDLSGWDADQSYDLPAGGSYVPLPPVAEPTSPAYRAALEQRQRARARGGLTP